MFLIHFLNPKNQFLSTYHLDLKHFNFSDEFANFVCVIHLNLENRVQFTPSLLTNLLEYHRFQQLLNYLRQMNAI